MTDGRTFAYVSALMAVSGLVVAVIGQFGRDAYALGGGGCVILFALVFAVLSLRDR